MDKDTIKEMIETLLIKMDNTRRSDDWAEYRWLLDESALSRSKLQTNRLY